MIENLEKLVEMIEKASLGSLNESKKYQVKMNILAQIELNVQNKLVVNS